MYICNICFSCTRHQMLEARVNAFRDYKLCSHRCSMCSQLVYLKTVYSYLIASQPYQLNSYYLNQKIIEH